MPLRYHRSTPSQFGDKSCNETDVAAHIVPSTESDRSPAVNSKRLPDVPLFSPFPTITARSPPSRSSSNGEQSPSPSLRSLILVESNLDNLRRSSMRASNVQDDVSAPPLRSTMASDNLFRLSALDALRREAFLEAEKSFNSSFFSRIPRTRESGHSTADEPCTPNTPIDLNITEDHSAPYSPPLPPKDDFLNLLSADEDCIENKSKSSTKGKNIFRAVFGRRNRTTRKALEVEKEEDRRDNQEVSLPCPAASFLDMDEEDATKHKLRSNLTSKFAFFGQQSVETPMRSSRSYNVDENGRSRQRCVSQTATSSSSVTAAKGVHKQLQRTLSKPVTLSQSHSTHTLAKSSWSWATESLKRKPNGKDNVPPMPALTQKTRAQIKGKISVNMNDVQVSSQLEAAHVQNGLGLHDAHGEAMALGDHINEHVFRRQSPPPRSTSLHPFPSQSSHDDVVDENCAALHAIESPLAASSILSFSTCNESIHRLANGQSLQSRLSTAQRYAQYSPPPSARSVVRPSSPLLGHAYRLPNSSASSIISLKQIRSTSVGSGHSCVPEPSTAALCDASTVFGRASNEPQTTTRKRETKATLARTQCTARRTRSRSPPLCPPPVCPLPPLPSSSTGVRTRR